MSQEQIARKDKSSISMPGIISWLNEILKLNLTRIEQLGSGSVYCLLFSRIHPEAIQIEKINWKAKNQYQFTKNLRLLQDGFAKVAIKRPLQPLKLAKAKCPDNFQLAVWLRNYYLEKVQETDCTFNSSVSQTADFSFAHRKITPKRFNPQPSRQEDHECSCCVPTEHKVRLQKRYEILRVKFEMLRQVLGSEQDADLKLTLIEELMRLQYCN